MSRRMSGALSRNLVLWVIRVGASDQIRKAKKPTNPTITVRTAKGLGNLNFSNFETSGSSPRARKTAANT